MDLATIIATDYPGLGTDTDAQVLAWLQSDVAVLGPVTRNTLLKWCVQTNALKELEGYKVNANVTIQSLAYAALELIRGPDGLDLADTDAQTQLAAMVTAGMFTQGEVDALNTSNKVPVWQHPDNQPLFLPRRARITGEPTLEHVMEARG